MIWAMEVKQFISEELKGWDSFQATVSAPWALVFDPKRTPMRDFTPSSTKGGEAFG